MTVNWHNDGQNFWDTHGDNFNQLKNRLMPPADQGFSAPAGRSRLSRPARRDARRLGGRVRSDAADHGEQRPRALAALLLGRAGGSGIRGGIGLWFVRSLGRPSVSDPVSPDDLGATILHALGIDPGTMVKDAVDRP